MKKNALLISLVFGLAFLMFFIGKECFAYLSNDRINKNEASSKTMATINQPASRAEGLFPGPVLMGSSSQKNNSQRPQYVPGEVVVGYKNEVTQKSSADQAKLKADFASQYGLTVKKESKNRPVVTFTIKDGQSVEEKVEELKQNPQVRYAEPNYYYYADIAPDDTDYGLLWGMENTGQDVNGTVGTADADVDAETAWDVRHTASDIWVTVIDSGVQTNHPDLGGISFDWDYIDDDAFPYDLDYVSHGTHVAGTIAAIGNNAQGVAGMAWDAQLSIRRVLDANGSGSNTDIADAIEDAIAWPTPQVINMSLGGSSWSQDIYDAIEHAKDHDILVVVAAGNDANDHDAVGGTPHYPCDYDLDNILCVAATDQNDDLATFSDWGDTSVDVAAPGVNIYSTIAGTAWSEDFEAPTTLNACATGHDGYDFAGTGLTVSGDDCTTGGWFVIDFSSGATPHNDITNWAGIGDLHTAYNSNNVDSYITSEVLPDVSAEPMVGLRFDYNFQTETSPTIACEDDYMAVEVWDDFDTAWEELDRFCNYTGYTGDKYGTWGIDLTSFASSALQVRFLWHTNGAGHLAGGDYFFLDNVEIYTASEDYGYMNGTSMATPMVTGLAALLRSEHPLLSYSETKEVIMDSVDVLNSLDDLIVTEGRVNATSALNWPVEDPIAILLEWIEEIINGFFKEFPLINLLDGIGYDWQTIYFRWNGGEWTQFTTPFFALEGNNLLEYYAVDSNGVASSIVNRTIKVDTLAPTVTLTTSPSIADGTNSYFKTAPTVTLTGDDGASGVTTIYYSLNGGSYQTYEDSFTIDETTTISYYAVDLADNQGTAQEQTIKVDTGTPVLQASGSLSRTRLTTVDIAGTASDALSGLDQVTVDSTAVTPDEQGAFETTVNLDIGQNAIAVVASDQAGNTTTVTINVTRLPNYLVVTPEIGKAPLKLYDSDIDLLATFYPYGSSFNSGFKAVIGDLEGDGDPEIITVPNRGGSPLVKVFTLAGREKTSFFAYDSSFRGGVILDAGDVDNDGKDEVVTLPASLGGSNCRIFGWRNGRMAATTVNFFIFPQNLRGGFSLTMPDMEPDGKAEIVVAPRSGGSAHLQVWGYRASERRYRPVILGLKVYAESFHGGITLASGDVDGGGDDEVITGTYSHGGPHVMIIYRKTNGTLAKLNPGFFAFSQNYHEGVNVGTFDYQEYGEDLIVVSPRGNAQPLVRFFDQTGRSEGSFYPYALDFLNGVNTN